MKRDQIQIFEDCPKEVSVEENFDLLLIPKDHPSRKYTDTYYIDSETVLRTHATAHQNAILSRGHRNFLIAGDVYRKDSVDKSHYFVFHQIDGVLEVPNNQDPRDYLEKVLTELMNFLFPGKSSKVSEDYFPFTIESLEVEVWFEDEWLEILGGGVVHPEITRRNDIGENLVAFGIGIERIAMLLFDIPDIRLFWSNDTKFLDQFSAGTVSKYTPFAKIDPIVFDISFFIENINEISEGDWIKLNEFYEYMREMGDGLIESVEAFDKFHHPKHKKTSYCFHVVFSPCASWTDPATLFAESHKNMQKIRNEIVYKFDIELR